MDLGVNNIIALLSGVALFLFGMSLMGDGLKKVAGNRLEVVLYKLTSTPLKGFLLGTGVTAVIQSSSATSVMVVGFVNSGMMQDVYKRQELRRVVLFNGGKIPHHVALKRVTGEIPAH